MINSYQPQGFDSLTAYVEATPQKGAFESTFRQSALKALDLVSTTLAGRGDATAADASSAMDDLRNSLQAVRQMSFRRRDDNVARTQDAIANSRTTREITLDGRHRLLMPAECQESPSLQEVRAGNIPYEAAVEWQVMNQRPTFGSIRPIASKLHTSPEYAAVDANELAASSKQEALNANGFKTLDAANKVSPTVQTLLAHPAFAMEESTEVDHSSTSSNASSTTTSRYGFFRPVVTTTGTGNASQSDQTRVTGTPVLEEALAGLQTLRDLITFMRPMPSTTLPVHFRQDYSETAKVRSSPLLGKDRDMDANVFFTRRPESNGTRYNSQQVVTNTLDTIPVECVPEHIALP